MDQQPPADQESSAESQKVKRAAVLCPGPSLPIFADREGYDIRIGVNRAVAAYRCDYWVALDTHTGGMAKPIGSPVIVNRSGIYRQMCRQFPIVVPLRHMDHSGLSYPPSKKRNIGWRRFGATVALVLAAHLEAKGIDCFGVDWRGMEDFDGFTSPKNRRSDNRWAREREVWQQVCDALAAQGVAVRRMSQPGEEAQPVG
jgi:hypothetical protein